ncbi:E-selectin-like [Branchiostoma floridae x Branchiostoma japonicum]
MWCFYKKCPDLTSPTNGWVSGSNLHQDQATFSCNPGYNVIGTNPVTCQADGTWNAAFPTCAAVQCPALTPPTNGGVSGENYYQNVATFTCDSGYNLVGTSTISCQADATWSAAFPTCAGVQCPALTSPTNGGVSGSNNYPDAATFYCNSGYNVVGTNPISCQADATWSAAFPTCAAGLCPTLSSPTNGAVSGSNSLGDTATFTCNSGYNLVGGSTRTCQADLTWSGSSPTCAAVQCPVLTPPTNGGVSGGNYYQDVATFTCDFGYDLCPVLSAPANGDVSGGNSYTDMVTFTCDSAVQCPVLTAPTNGGVSGGNSYGDVATFTCDSGYSLSGSATLTCQADTTWDGASPTCAAGLCPTLTPPTNGAVSGSNSLGDVATFTCNSGYNLVGGSTRTSVQCSVLTAPTNGGVSGGNSYTDMATFTCDSGYSLVGDSSRTCQADGTWTGSSPTCTGIQRIAPTLSK